MWYLVTVRFDSLHCENHIFPRRKKFLTREPRCRYRCETQTVPAHACSRMHFCIRSRLGLSVRSNSAGYKHSIVPANVQLVCCCTGNKFTFVLGTGLMLFSLPVCNGNGAVQEQRRPLCWQEDLKRVSLWTLVFRTLVFSFFFPSSNKENKHFVRMWPCCSQGTSRTFI